MDGKTKIFEYRGVKNVVYAKIIEDTEETYETGAVKPLAGVSEITKNTETSSESKYYDDVPALVINSTGADEIACQLAGIPLETVAEITGQYYDETTGMFVEGEREEAEYALGYITGKTDGSEVYVWRLKGTFSIPGSTHKTKDSGTEGNGQELTYTGISTTHKFSKTGKRAKAINVDVGKKLADVTDFFQEVTTPDTVKAKAAATKASAPVKRTAEKTTAQKKE